MATTGRRQTAAMNEATPSGSWFAWLRYLENRSQASPLGEFFPPSQEALRLRAGNRLGYPTTEVTRINREAERPEVTTTMWGLTGPMGALPYVYTEEVARALRERNFALPDFLDIFNHRAQSLLYRAWRKYRYFLDKERDLLANERYLIDKERAPARAGSDRYTQLLAALSGLAEPTTTNNTNIPLDALLSYGGLLTRQVRTAAGLEQLLRHQFNLNIHIQQFVGRWSELAPDVRTQLRRTPRIAIKASANGNNQLGISTVLGRYTWQANSVFRVIIDNPSPAQYRALAPGGEALHTLQLLVRLYAGVEFDFELELHLKENCLEPAQISANKSRTPVLGWNSLMGKAQPEKTTVVRITRNYPIKSRVAR